MAPKKQLKKTKSNYSQKTNFFSIVKVVAAVSTVFALGIAAGFVANKKFNIQNYFNTDKEVQKYSQQPVTPAKIETVDIYLLKGEKSKGLTYLEYVPVKRPVKKGQQRLFSAIKELLKGPSSKERQQGYNTEIPPETKLLGITSNETSQTINLSEDFQFGGGTDSMKARVYQLIKTATQASEGKDVYLELNGEKVEVIGGEGIIINQPLNKNL
jgi:spore germination protein GerM